MSWPAAPPPHRLERNRHDNLVPESQPRRLMPTDLDYRGAFRLPRDTLGDTWEWSGTAGGMTYREGGDARGGDDGYPGSLYISGHAWRMQVAEVSIPAPALTEGMDVTRLPLARTLQDFHPVAGRLAAVESLEIMRTGLAFLPFLRLKGVGRSLRLRLALIGPTEVREEERLSEGEVDELRRRMGRE